MLMGKNHKNRNWNSLKSQTGESTKSARILVVKELSGLRGLFYETG